MLTIKEWNEFDNHSLADDVSVVSNMSGVRFMPSQQRQRRHQQDMLEEDSYALNTLFFQAVSKVQKMLQCAPCDSYVKEQVEFERRSQDVALPMDVHMYNAFLRDD